MSQRLGLRADVIFIITILVGYGRGMPIPYFDYVEI